MELAQKTSFDSNAFRAFLPCLYGRNKRRFNERGKSRNYLSVLPKIQKSIE